MDNFTLPMALFLAAGAIALFSFLAVATWSDNRRREREAFYRGETLKKLAEMSTDGAVNLLREEERLRIARRRDGIRLGGFVMIAAGIGVGVFLRGVSPHHEAFLLGIPAVLVGAALLGYSYMPAPKE
jgi:ferric-dicitrate binding protein FerR (iron transport regulator)